MLCHHRGQDKLLHLLTPHTGILESSISFFILFTVISSDTIAEIWHSTSQMITENEMLQNMIMARVLNRRLAWHFVKVPHRLKVIAGYQHKEELFCSLKKSAQEQQRPLYKI